MTQDNDEQELPLWAHEMLRKQAPDETQPDDAPATGDEHPVYLRNPRLREVVDLLIANPSAEFRDTMLDCGLVGEDHLLEALSIELGLERVDWTAVAFDSEVLTLISAEVAWRLVAFPVRINEESGALCVAFADPFDRAAVEELERLTGRRVAVMLTSPDEILRHLGAHYL